MVDTQLSKIYNYLALVAFPILLEYYFILVNSQCFPHYIKLYSRSDGKRPLKSYAE